MRNLTLVALLAWPVLAQPALTVQQAVDNALANNPAIQASAESGKIAGARLAEARGARLPRLDYTESWTRSNNPVFVFGSLLNQREFTASNFDLGSLNNPGFLNNFQSQVTVEQTLYDNGARRARINAAEQGQALTAEQSRRSEMAVIIAVLRAYYSALLNQENVRVAAESVRSAEADLQRAQNRREAGFATDADVLSIQVHVAAMREQQIRRTADLELSLAGLNEAMGLPLDSHFELSTPLTATAAAAAESAEVEKDALSNRPEARASRVQTAMHREQEKGAHAALRPEFYLRGGFEADRQQFVTRGGANWLLSAGLRWNLFNGFSDRARIDGARHEIERSRAQERQVDSAVQLEARGAWLELRSANERMQVARSAVAMAQESLRIIRNRYEAGLTEVTELLRAETALLDAQTRDLAAIRDQRLAAVSVEAARGKLSKDSDVVKQ